MRAIIDRAAVVLGTIVLIVVIGEIVVRSIPTVNDSTIREARVKYRFNPYQPVGRLGYKLRPNWETVHASNDFQVSVHTNNLGLRGKDIQEKKPNSIIRILVLGDSFTFGYGVENNEAFPAQLEMLLSNHLNRRVEVINSGVPGWSTAQYWIFLKEYGFDLEPDLVLVAIMENDLSDLGLNQYTFDDELLPISVESTRIMIDHRGRMHFVNDGHLDMPKISFPGKQWISNHMQLYHWIRYRLVRLWLSYAESEANRSQAKEAGVAPNGPIKLLSPGELLRGLKTGNEFQLRYHRYIIEAIERECADRNILVEYLLIANNGSNPKDGTPLRKLHDDCLALGQRCLDTANIFPPTIASESFFRQDPHWNAAGHRCVAVALANRLGKLMR
jgi:hypothetical protein